jgi:hypothetical protein
VLVPMFTDVPRRRAAFSPADVSGLVLRVVAAAGDMFTDAGGTTPADDGGLIYTAADRAGNFAIQQATAADRPEFRYSIADGRFHIRSNSDDWLGVSGTALDNVSAFSLFAAGFASAAPGGEDTLIGFGASGERGLIRRAGGSDVWEVQARLGANNVLVTTATAVPVGTRFVIGVVVDSSLGSDEVKVYSGSTQIGAGTQAGTPEALPGTMRILTDAFSAARGWPGGLYEVLAYDRAVTAGELASIAAYLATA